MNCVAVKEAKNRFTHLLHLVENNEPVQISRHGKVVAVLSSVGSFNEAAQNSSFAEGLRLWREKSVSVLSQSDFTNDEIDRIFCTRRTIENAARPDEMGKVAALWDEK